MLYKYLQGNDINEGRELFAVSKDGRIPSSVLKLWKEIFTLHHAWQEGKGRWRQPGRKMSLIRKNKQGRNGGGNRCLRGADLDAATCEALPGAQPHPTDGSSNPAFDIGTGSEWGWGHGAAPADSTARQQWGIAPWLLLRGSLGVPGTSSAPLPAPLGQSGLIPKRPNFHVLFSSSQIAQGTSSIPCPLSTQVHFICKHADGIRPCQDLGIRTK